MTRWQAAAHARAQARQADRTPLVYVAGLLIALAVLAWVGRQ